ncbi:MAG: GNAT family N-acetyltransferase [Desulfuromonadaceae bacterium]|nr:GNAT family N-acetyltransferase [Desulfuromonadaceae bacterium]
MNKDFSIRQFDPLVENPVPIFNLFERVYGDASTIRKRWNWEILSHPDCRNIRIFIAEHHGNLIGMTVRMPYTLVVNEVSQAVFFASNSMVDPDYRGHGVIGKLYDVAAAKTGAMQFSKGTAAAMQAVLRKKGYREVLPSNYQVCILSPLRWMIGKIAKRSVFQPVLVSQCLDNKGYSQIQRFPDYYEEFAKNALSKIGGGLLKTAGYMNWRYFRNPHRNYLVFLRNNAEKVSSMLVLRVEGTTAYIVDMLWDPAVPDEPAGTLGFARSTAKKLGACKLVAWGSLHGFRDACRRNFFITRKESPSFSWFPNQSGTSLDCMSSVHIVHGDGDIDYL